jgi:quinol monooxygenase YgiN
MEEPAGMVTFVAKEGCLSDLIELLGKMAAVAGRDDGCEIYAVHQSRRHPNIVFLYELYRDKDAMKLHQANQELKDLGSGLGDLTESVEIVTGNLVAGDRARRS